MRDFVGRDKPGLCEEAKGDAAAVGGGLAEGVSDDGGEAGTVMGRVGGADALEAQEDPVGGGVRGREGVGGRKGEGEGEGGGRGGGRGGGCERV